MEKIKSFIESEKGKDVLIVLIVIFVGLASFELGRLSKQDASNGLKIDYTSESANALSSYSPNMAKSQNEPQNDQKEGQNQGSYFASKKGKKYYPVGCSAGNNIKLENKIYFSSSTDAENAGYILSSSCK